MLKQRQNTTQQMIRDLRELLERGQYYDEEGYGADAFHVIIGEKQANEIKATAEAISDRVFIIRAGRTDYQIEATEAGALVIMAIIGMDAHGISITPRSGNVIELRPQFQP